MSGPQLNQDFLDLLHALRDARAAFLVVDAHAMAVHGVPRATGDLDVLVRPDPQKSARVMAALQAFGAPVAAHGLVEADFARPELVYQMGLPPSRIDLLTSISGVSFEEAWASHVTVEVDGMSIDFLGRDALIANKRASARPKDLVDVALLERQT